MVGGRLRGTIQVNKEEVQKRYRYVVSRLSWRVGVSYEKLKVKRAGNMSYACKQVGDGLTSSW